MGSLFKGLYPLWGRQIPYTVMKFASFETTVQYIYAYLPKDKSEYGKPVQTGVSFLGGYIAGILCAIVSHPADVMVSQLNANRKGGEGFGGAVGRIYKEIGFGGLWNGLPVRIVMIGTLTGLQWLIYDSFKIFCGLPTTVSSPKLLAGLLLTFLGRCGVSKGEVTYEVRRMVDVCAILAFTSYLPWVLHDFLEDIG